MDSFVEKFNIFDLFTMLIPGMIISSLFGISLSLRYYSIWESFGNEKYVLFFIFSYVCGVVFQELGTMIDNKILYKILYGGNPKEVYLLRYRDNKIFDNEISYKDALHIKDYFIRSGKIPPEYIKAEQNIENEKKLNSFIYSYCLNISQKNKITAKSDKMMIISEMSRSLFWGCLCTILIDLFMIMIYVLDIVFEGAFYCKFYHIIVFYSIEILFLVLASILFLIRKKRYEKFGMRVLIKNFLTYIEEKNNIYL